MTDYVPPKLSSNGFNCPHCGAFSQQNWTQGYSHFNSFTGISSLNVAFCQRCEKYSVWISDKMIYPVFTVAPLPHPSFPESMKQDYDEARNVLSTSSRSASALLRLIIEKLTDGILGTEKGKDLNTNIGKLVEKGLPKQIQQSLDILRVIGNNSLHPGQIDITDNTETALSLFNLTNLIVDYMIAKPNEIKQLYDKLPTKDKQNIEKRDGKTE